ncbi:hypothetical protein CLIB1423_15S02366 [[Candida] railenensis]|uniref:Uncharacterized protein n=1 Tax=[Candida] railenensis TaxID=45579 RepID=A0A9P0VZT4_9ASCO|nr:hypothetical protein CLIB1423_15S02366 [[Candida] railenensis]
MDKEHGESAENLGRVAQCLRLNDWRKKERKVNFNPLKQNSLANTDSAGDTTTLPKRPNMLERWPTTE